MDITVEQFNQLVTKDHLEVRLQSFKKEITEDIKEEMATKSQFYELMAAVQNIAKQFQDFKAEMAAFHSITQRHDRRFGKIGNILKIDYHDVDDVI